MYITVVTTIYKQHGAILDFYSETEKQYQTNKYNGDVVSGCRNLLSDFRKNKLIVDNNKVSFKKLYINGQLVAMIEPRFIINNEVFESFSDCYVAYDNESFSDCYVAYDNESLSINDITVIKQLTKVNRQLIIDVLSSN